MSRIPYPDVEAYRQSSEPKRQALEEWGDKLMNVQRMFLHCPDGVWLGQRALARSTVLRATIDLRLRELLILRVAWLSESDYEVFHHLSLAKSLGNSDAEIEAMRTGDFSAIGAQEAALGRFVTEIVEDVNPSDAVMDAIREHFSDPQVLEMIMIIGYYMMVARAIAATGIEVEEDAISDWSWLNSDDAATAGDKVED